MLRYQLARNYADLDEWLAATTRGLCAEAKERVSEEMSEHFCDAQAAHMAAGCSEADAAAKALRELGNPRRERQRLRREHFTAMEAICFLRSEREELPKPPTWKQGGLIVIANWAVIGLFCALNVISNPPIVSTDTLIIFVVVQGSLGPLFQFLLQRDRIKKLQGEVQQEFDPEVAQSRIRGNAIRSFVLLLIGVGLMALVTIPAVHAFFEYSPMMHYFLLCGLATFVGGLLTCRLWMRQKRIYEKRYAGMEAR